MFISSEHCDSTTNILLCGGCDLVLLTEESDREQIEDSLVSEECVGIADEG